MHRASSARFAHIVSAEPPDVTRALIDLAQAGAMGAVLAAPKTVELADICITSGAALTGVPIPVEAFCLPWMKGVGVIFERAEGRNARAAGEFCRTWASTPMPAPVGAAVTCWAEAGACFRRAPASNPAGSH